VGEVEQALLDLDVNKGPGPDKIPSSILKYCAASFSLPLCLIFNRSLATSVFPEKWKLSFVTPIFKNGKRNDVSNYRGIAILSAVAKLFELLICRSMYEDLKGLLSENQHGFVKGRSTVSNLVEYSSFILKSMEKGLQVDSVYTDFSKAFDKVRHCLLCPKLAASPIEPARCELMRSYLSGRIQRVRIGGCVSSEIKVTSGVPQGSHLGPLCFIWFVNELSLIFKYVRVLFYADDMKLFLPVGSSQDCLKIQSDLDRLAQWCNDNALPLNVGKCKTITFTRNIAPVRFDYKIGSSTLERVESITDLGVIFDAKMSFRNHIDATIAKGLAMLGFIKRLSNEFRDPYTLKALYVSLVRSRLEYACCVWQPFYVVHIDRIERIQEKFIKYALRRLGWNANSDLPPYHSRCGLINLETLEIRRDIARIMYVFDILSGKVSSAPLLAEVGFRIPSYATRRHEFLHIDYHRTNYGAFEPINAALNSFNDIANFFDFNVSRKRFVTLVKSNLRTG
jgi:Reverse transcriptase (RNA-dependent DNA polymerase)